MKNIMDTLRTKVSSGSVAILSHPYLPSGLIWAALFLAYTDCIVVLLGQPAAFWIDRSRAVSQITALQSLLSVGLFAYLLLALLYLVLLWIGLTILTRSLALILWLVLSFIHLSHVLDWAIIASRLMNGDAMTSFTNIATGAVTSLVLGIVLVLILLRQTTQSENPGRPRRWLKPVVFWGWIIGLIALVLISAISPRGGWVQIHPKHTPGRRAISAVAYDSARNRLVFFGGISEWIGSSFYYEHDTWEWDGKDWTELKPKTSPPSRAGHMMAYDEKNGVVVLFGGEDKSGTYMLSDTWIWDGKDWTQMFPTGYPIGRRGGQMFYDPETEKVILTGGFYYATGKVFTAVNDTWAWNGKDWEYITNFPNNLMITNPNVAYVPSLKHPILYDYKRLLQWTNNEWLPLDVSNMPVNRFGPWLSADSQSGKMMIFGGIDNNVQRNDTWLFENGAWKELHPNLMPSSRDAHVMFYDPTRGSFIVYGGINTYALDDMWEYVLP